jgi:amidohydrolase
LLCYPAGGQSSSGISGVSISDAALSTAIDHAAPAMIALRHQIHQHPELANREFETAKLVAGQLHSLNIDVRTGIAHTGVVGILTGGQPGPVVAVRAELDALQVTEDSKNPFRSTVRTTLNGEEVGVAHACGHDIHIAAILGVAAVLASMRAQLAGTVMFIFQPAEEGPPAGEEGGAELMLKEGIFSDVKPAAVFGLHSFGTLDVGQIRYSVGPTTAALSDFRIQFHGKQGHAGYPQETIDPVIMAAEAVLQLQTIRSRSLSQFDPGAISVTMVHTGVRTNIIPDTATLGGTIRVFDDKVIQQVEQRIRQIVDGIARGAGGTVQVTFTDHLPAVVSDPALVKRVLPALDRVAGAGNVKMWPAAMAADDFAYFTQVAPGFFFLLGTQNPGTTSGMNHAPNFRADDAAIPIGMYAMTEVLLEYFRTAKN